MDETEAARACHINFSATLEPALSEVLTGN